MSRPWRTWLALSLCMAIVLGAMGWVTLAVLRLDRAEAEMRRQAALEENVRLAMWRMESAAAALIAEENSRPYFQYRAFYPAERAYTRMFAKIGRGDVLIPSPLLTFHSPYILLHFQIGPDGKVTSPQVPTGNVRDLAVRGYLSEDEIADADQRLKRLRPIVDDRGVLADLPQPKLRLASTSAKPPQQLPAEQQAERQLVSKGQARTAQEQRQIVSNIAQQMQVRAPQRAWPRGAVSNVAEGAIRPVWIGTTLVLARRVTVNGQPYVQGCWLDWPVIRTWLLGSIKDLLPKSRLEPVHPEREAAKKPRLLAALPVRLVAGQLAGMPDQALSPLRVSLAIVWVCVVFAALAVAVLLRGAVALSERRATFVSAVTHELRTPLTTFRMYTEMLAEGMIADDAKRQSYLGTLLTEAERLSHLVENVLAYARLERGAPRARAKAVRLDDLLARITDRLVRHAEQAGMALIVEDRQREAQRIVRADESAVEQILFNLVDNACKYARAASDNRIHLDLDGDTSAVEIHVRDNGPGIDRRDAKRLFRPFVKSAKDAANSAPGVGLGLALSRRLARSMGGDLTAKADVDEGACFVLKLPAEYPTR